MAKYFNIQQKEPIYLSINVLKQFVKQLNFIIYFYIQRIDIIQQIFNPDSFYRGSDRDPSQDCNIFEQLKVSIV